MNFRTVVVALGLAALSLPAAAQDVAGKWNANIEMMPGQAMTLVFDFTIEGGALKGTVSNEMSGATPISDGKIQGGKINFNTVADGGPAGQMVITYAGALEDGKIMLQMGLGGDAAAQAAAAGFEMPKLTLTRAPE